MVKRIGGSGYAITPKERMLTALERKDRIVFLRGR